MWCIRFRAHEHSVRLRFQHLYVLSVLCNPPSLLPSFLTLSLSLPLVEKRLRVQLLRLTLCLHSLNIYYFMLCGKTLAIAALYSVQEKIQQASATAAAVEARPVL